MARKALLKKEIYDIKMKACKKSLRNIKKNRIIFRPVIHYNKFSLQETGGVIT